MIKRVLFIFLAAVLNTEVKAQDSANEEPFLTKSLAGQSIQRVMARTSGGNISVSSTGAGKERLEIYVRQSGGGIIRGQLSKEEIRQRIDQDYDLSVSVAGNRLTVTAKQKQNNWKRQLSISYKIFVPQNVSSDLSTSGGNISLAGLSGTQEFNTSGGNLNLDKLSGTITGRTSGGNINLADSKETIDLSTSGGNINALNCSGSLKLSTSGGSLNLSGLQGIIQANTSGGTVHGEHIKGELSAHTSGGNIALNDLACSLEASTSGGNINADLAETGKYVKIGTSGGNINLVMPAGKGLNLDIRGDRIQSGTLVNFNGSMDKEHIKGTLNGGGIPVSLKASDRITLALR